MGKWELARYLIDAKKSIDTILYLSKYGEKVSMIDIRSTVNETKRNFYVNVCILLDKCFPKKKKEICKDEQIKSVYYERDKNYAHKDDDYAEKQYGSIGAIAEEMKQQLDAVHKLCLPCLPAILTLDYLAFDSKLFRIANGVTKEKEEAALNIKHPGRLYQGVSDATCESKIYSVFSDTEGIKRIPPEKRKEYATLIQVGIVLEETLQRFQDSCIRTNVLYGADIWVSINYMKLHQIERIRELGLVDTLDVPYIPKNQKDERRIIKILTEEGLIDEPFRTIMSQRSGI